MTQVKGGISFVESPLSSKAAGPRHRVALIFQCTEACQYFGAESRNLGDGAKVTTFTCKRQSRKIGTVNHFANQKADYPETPDWCAFADFAYKDSVASINNLLDDVERLSMTAIKLSKPLAVDSQNPNYRKASFNFFYPIKGVARLATGHVHVHHRHIVSENRLLVQFVEYHKTERNALIEFPEEIMPGMSRRAWVRKDDLFNAPPL